MIVLQWPVARTKILLRLAAADESILARMDAFESHWTAAHAPESDPEYGSEQSFSPSDDNATPEDSTMHSDEIGGNDAGGVPDYLR